jgi:hypothetical protein
MTCLSIGQQLTVHGPRRIFLNIKHLLLLSLDKKRIITLIGRGGKDVIPPLKGARGIFAGKSISVFNP